MIVFGPKSARNLKVHPDHRRAVRKPRRGGVLRREGLGFDIKVMSPSLDVGAVGATTSASTINNNCRRTGRHQAYVIVENVAAWYGAAVPSRRQ